MQRTVGYEEEKLGKETALADTVGVSVGAMGPHEAISEALGATGAVTSSAGQAGRRTAAPTTTVLPRFEEGAEGPVIAYEARPRYAATKLLGEGGMGTVELAEDQDIARQVALKRIRPEIAGGAGLARFVEEVRTIGQLEHPNIVPIHDVGVDEEGRYFFVMKYVEGETLETIIERLAAGDPVAHRQYTFETRVQIMIGLLRALAFAHDRAIIHRDVKPANVMVGPYGEVVLMDWGIARAIGGKEPAMATGEEAAPATDTTRRRLVETAQAQLVGTPAYMAPEQAQGRPDLDARCDLYAASVVFHELMTLGHYLPDVTSVPQMLTDVVERELPPALPGAYAHPTQGPIPSEYVHFIRQGMNKDRGERFASAQEMIDRLEDALEGKIRVQCHATMTKRMAREAGRFVDRHPHLATAMFLTSVAMVLGAMAVLVAALVG